MSNLRFWLSWMILLALLLAGVTMALSHWNLQQFSSQVGDRLQLLGELRRGALQQYFSTARAELRFWSTNPELLQVQSQLNELWQDPAAASLNDELRSLYIDDNPNPPGYYLNLDDAEDGSAYSALHAAMHPRTRRFVTQRGYYDFFLIGPQGDIYYTVEKESDFATNLQDGRWRDSGLGQVFTRAKKEQGGRSIAMSDMAAYGPSDGAPAIFMATAMHNEAGEFIGVIAFQLPTNRILGIMAYTEGMGESGETYLVGQDQLMRSDSRFSEDSTVLQQEVHSRTTKLALQGEQGIAVVHDYRSIPVLSAYLPMELGDERWAIMAEIDVAEIESSAAAERPALAGALAIIYGLSLWTVWYWRGRHMPQDMGDGVQLSDLDFGDDGGGAGGGGGGAG